MNELISLGYLTLESDPKDRRAKIIRYTEKGARLGLDAIAGLKHVETVLAERIGTGNVKMLREALSIRWGEPYKVS